MITVQRFQAAFDQSACHPPLLLLLLVLLLVLLFLSSGQLSGFFGSQDANAFWVKLAAMTMAFFLFDCRPRLEFLSLMDAKY
jgi:hypothetical protein